MTIYPIYPTSYDAGLPWSNGIRVVRRVVTAYDPDDDPLTLATVRDDHLRVTSGNVENSYIQGLIETSLRMAQRETQRRILPETWKLVMSGFPTAHIELPYPPLIEVVSVTYYDEAGDAQTLDADSYMVDAPIGPEAARGVVRMGDGVAWPSTFTRSDAVSVTFRCGYVDPTASPEEVDVPADLTHARLLIIKDLYEQRGSSSVGVGTSVTPNVYTATAIFKSYRDLTVAG